MMGPASSTVSSTSPRRWSTFARAHAADATVRRIHEQLDGVDPVGIGRLPARDA
jgi:hypothetical protein